MITRRTAASISRQTALVVFATCIVLLVAMWVYQASLDDWGDARTILFTAGPFVLGVVGLGALALLGTDLVRERRT